MVFRKLTFDNIDSLANGVYITGEASYNSPKRDAEMVVIPGRNGELVRDNGRFENIEVTYPAGAKDQSLKPFNEVIRDFRNLLASKKGYCRLTDDYNPNEFRQAAFVEAVEVEPTGSQRAGEFDIKFNCKPQRFLTSGESKIGVNSGYTIVNPTKFDAQPMIEATGFGSLNVNGYDITITNSYLGYVILYESTDFSHNKVITYDDNLVVYGDTITIDGFSVEIYANSQTGGKFSNIVEKTPPTYGTGTITASSGTWRLNLSFDPMTFTQGGSLAFEDTWTFTATTTPTPVTEDVTLRMTVNYYGDDTIYFHAQLEGSLSFTNKFKFSGGHIGDITADSTVSTLGHPTYIDCEFGEVYKIENGSVISLNHLVDLGSNLPVLSPGNNVITMDNTFTTVEIIPRWWIV